MDLRIPGAFVIRNTKTKQVLHTDEKSTTVWMETQDEENYRSEQIWWIDIAEGCHIPTNPEEEQHLLYTITNQSLGSRLRYATPETVDKDGPVTIASQESVAGQGVQFWRISLVDGEASTSVPSAKSPNCFPSNLSSAPSENATPSNLPTTPPPTTS